MTGANRKCDSPFHSTHNNTCVEMFYVPNFGERAAGEFLVIFHASRGHNQYEIGVSGYVVALHYFRHGLDGTLEFFDGLWPVCIERHFHDRGQTSA